MATVTINELQQCYVPRAKQAQKIAQTQGKPAYVVLGSIGQVRATFPGVWCHRVHANGEVDCAVIVA